MSVNDEAEKLRNYSNAYVENSINATIECGNDINSAIRRLETVKEAAAHSVAVVSEGLGSDHPGTANMVNSAEFLIANAEELRAMLNAVIDKMLELDQNIGNHGNLMADIANAILRGQN